MIGVLASNQRVNPFDSTTTFEVQVGSTVANTTPSRAAYDGSDTVAFKDIEQVDIMTGSTPWGTFTDVDTTAPAGNTRIWYSNGYLFGRDSTNSKVVVYANGVSSAESNFGSEDVRDVVWYSNASLYVGIGADATATPNCLVVTTPDLSTYTTRADAFTGDRGDKCASSGTMLWAVGNNGKGRYTTSTSAPFTWNSSTSFNSAVGTESLDYIEYFPEKSTWVVGASGSFFFAYSTDGTTWTAIAPGSNTGNAGSLYAKWIPALDRWILGSNGNSINSQKGRYVYISNSSSISGSYTILIDDEQTTAKFAGGDTHLYKNSYIFHAIANQKLRYTRAG